jgi:pyruvate kinase
VPFGTPGATNLLHIVTLRGNELELYRAVNEDGRED